MKKSLNITYNNCYNISNTEITFNPHLFERKEERKLDLGKIEETIKTGKIKGEFDSKVIFSRYFGKENITYEVVTIHHKNSIEVKTAWEKKGR